MWRNRKADKCKNWSTCLREQFDRAYRSKECTEPMTQHWHCGYTHSGKKKKISCRSIECPPSCWRQKQSTGGNLGTHHQGNRRVDDGNHCEVVRRNEIDPLNATQIGLQNRAGMGGRCWGRIDL